MDLTLAQFRDMVAEKVMPSLDFLQRAIVAGLLNTLNAETYAVIMQITGEVEQAYRVGGIDAVQALLREYQIPEELIGLVARAQAEDGALRSMTDAMGLPAELLEVLGAAAQDPHSQQ